MLEEMETEDQSMTPMLRKRPDETGFWCGFRVILLIGLVTSVVVYTIGAIIAGIALHSWNSDVSCTSNSDESPSRYYPVITPLDAVGPSLMSFGGGILVTILVEWFLLKPVTTYTLRD